MGLYILRIVNKWSTVCERGSVVKKILCWTCWSKWVLVLDCLWCGIFEEERIRWCWPVHLLLLVESSKVTESSGNRFLLLRSLVAISMSMIFFLKALLTVKMLLNLLDCLSFLKFRLIGWPHNIISHWRVVRLIWRFSDQTVWEGLLLLERELVPFKST